MTERDGDDLGIWSEFGTAAGIAASRAAAGPVQARSGLGDRPDEGGAGASMAEVYAGWGDAPDLDGLPPVTGLGEAPSLGGTVGDAFQEAAAKVRELTPPKGYHNTVDADGDGHDEKATYHGRADGGADILVDLNHDGQTDFIGHDVDLDNRVDFADYDKDHDGFFEKRMYDDNGDGYLDRAVWIPDS